MEIKETSLINLHKSHGAKLVEFAGYNMPIQYSGGILDEHKYTRSNCGVFDVSHMGQLFIYGKDDLTKDLEKIFPVDLESLKKNQSKYSFLMNDNGGIYDDLIITKLNNGYLIILNAACKKNDLKIIQEKLNNKYQLELKDNLSLIALQGPGAKNVLEKVIPQIDDLKFMHGKEFKFCNLDIYITRSGYTGEDGFEISLPNEIAEKFTKSLLENGSKLIGLGARDTLRMEAGLCLYGNDIDTGTTPIEANLKWAISKKRINDQYPGSEIIKKQIQSGVKRLRVGIRPDTKVIARANTKIFNEESKEIGKVTSGTFGPSVDHPISMGYVHNDYSSLDTKIFLEIRGKKFSANICKLPFYQKNYVKEI
jgi:aminomethyltransferase